MIKFRSPVYINPVTKMKIHYYWLKACRKNVIKCTGRNAILLNIVFLFMFFLINIPAFAETAVTLAWDPNEEPEVIGYNVYWKTHVNESYDNTRMSEILEQDFDNPLFPEITFYFPENGVTYFFVATALDGVNESGYSNEVQWTAPIIIIEPDPPPEEPPVEEPPVVEPPVEEPPVVEPPVEEPPVEEPPVIDDPNVPPAEDPIDDAPVRTKPKKKKSGSKGCFISTVSEF